MQMLHRLPGVGARVHYKAEALLIHALGLGNGFAASVIWPIVSWGASSTES